LLLFDLFHCDISAFPVDGGGFAFGDIVVLEVELFGELLISYDIILPKFENNGEVICPLLINDMDVLEGLEEWFIIGAHELLDNLAVGEYFEPVVWDFPGLEVVLDLGYLVGSEVFVKVSELLLEDGLEAFDELGDVLEDRDVELEVLRFEGFGLGVDLRFDLSDLFVSLVDG
jgi:hypothetical protein